LELVPDEVDAVIVLADRLGRPRAAAGLFDEGEAGVDAGNVVGEVAAADRCHGEIVVDKPRGVSGADSRWDGRGVGVGYEDSLSAGREAY
jgi:hypothetical protein